MIFWGLFITQKVNALTFFIQTYSAKESGSSRRYAIPWHPIHNSGQPAQASSLASLGILIPGRSFLTPGRSVLKDFEAFWSRLSPAEVHTPLHFLDFFDFLKSCGEEGGTPPIFENFCKYEIDDPSPKTIFPSMGSGNVSPRLEPGLFCKISYNILQLQHF